jgi:hypothetical protein
MIVENGEVTEVDYGFVAKERISNDQNLYLEKNNLI